MGVETRKRLVWACTMRPSPCAFASSGFIERFVGADDAPPAADRHAAGFPPAALLKSVLLVLPAAENLPFRPKGGRSARLCGILYPQSALFFPSRHPARAGSRIPPAACGNSVCIRSLRPHAGQASARSRSAGNPLPRTKRRARARQAEAVRSLWQHTPMSYGAGPARLLPVARRPLPHKQAEADGGEQRAAGEHIRPDGRFFDRFGDRNGRRGAFFGRAVGRFLRLRSRRKTLRLGGVSGHRKRFSAYAISSSAAAVQPPSSADTASFSAARSSA